MTGVPRALRQVVVWLAAPLRLYRRIERRELGLIAAGVAFFGFLAIFPAVAAVIALWGFAADPAVIRTQLAVVQDFLPAEAFQLIAAQVEALLAANNRQLGWATLVSTGFALWSARAGAAALIRGVNLIHDLPARGGLWHQLSALVLTLVLVGLAICATLVAVVMPLALVWLPLGPTEAAVLDLANLALGAALVVMVVGLIYRLGLNWPSGRRRPRLFTRGLLLAVLLWGAASRGLVWYLGNFGNYNEVYGSIGAVAALLMWFYLAAYAILLGAAVDAERAARRPG